MRAKLQVLEFELSERRDTPLTPAPSAEWQARQEEFVQANMRRVFLIIYRIVGNVPDAQDLTQETFIKALQRQEQLKDLDKAAHWLSRIASNTAIDFLRRQGRAHFTEIDETMDPLPTAAERSPQALLLQSEQQEYLQEGLNADAEGAPGTDSARCRGFAGRGSRAAPQLRQSDGAFAHCQCANEVPEVPGEEETVKNHPAPEVLALYSCGDLDIWAMVRTGAHVHLCGECGKEVQAIRRAVAQLKSDALNLPAGLDWDQMAAENARQHPARIGRGRDCG